ncbi:MAG: primosomal protein N' [Pseudomonadota bacterium]
MSGHTETRLSVLLPHKLGLLTYGIDAASTPTPPGTIVAAPLGGRTLLGVVWDDPPDETVPEERLKPIVGPASAIRIGHDLRRFVDFVARYTMTPRGAVLKMVLRAPEALAPPKPRMEITRCADVLPDGLTPARVRVWQALAAGSMSRQALAAAAEVSPGVVSAMVKAGQLVTVEVAPLAAPGAGDAASIGMPPNLSESQKQASETLVNAAKAGRFAPILLDGVTGSGKTEVYLEAVAEALSAGRQGLILMPEIALTPMVVDRITARFGHPPATWHSGRTPAARANLWRDVAEGRAPIVVGARSALFLPFRDLGVVIVDEEHDQSYKQDDGVTYHARDMAIVRAQEAKVPVILASATPSVETHINAERGRYQRVSLPSRFGSMPLPAIAPVDLKATPPPKGDWLAPPVRAAISQTLEAGEQALLFLNRRGYAPLTICRQCGHRIHCPNCSAAMVEHRLRGRLVCHHCGHEEPRITTCPKCKAEDSMTACGPGVERVAEEAAALWPDASLLTLSSDLGGPNALSEALDTISNGAVDLIVGTQLVAKGHTFPKLQLVVVVDADMGLDNADPRAGERTFQLLTQVTGRAGRVSSGGRALLQTYAPDHPIIAAMMRGDRQAFYEEETNMRQAGGLPPYERLAAIIVSATDRSEAYGHAVALARTAPNGNIEVLGPAEAPLAVLRGRYRYRLLIRAPRTVPLQKILSPWLSALPLNGSLRRAVDIDPQSFL